MIVCGECGYPLYGTSRPEMCPNVRCDSEGADWIESELFEQRLEEERQAAEEREAAEERRVKGRKSKRSHIPCPNVIGDRLPKSFYWELGAEVDSKSQRKRLAEAKGCHLVSGSAHYREEGKPPGSSTTAVSYAGQKKLKSRRTGPAITPRGNPII